MPNVAWDLYDNRSTLRESSSLTCGFAIHFCVCARFQSQSFGSELRNIPKDGTVLCMATEHITTIEVTEPNANFRVHCSCGTTIHVASQDRDFAEDCAERHIAEAPAREAEEAANAAWDALQEQESPLLIVDWNAFESIIEDERDFEPDPDTDREERWAKAHGLW